MELFIVNSIMWWRLTVSGDQVIQSDFTKYFFFYLFMLKW